VVIIAAAYISYRSLRIVGTHTWERGVSIGIPGRKSTRTDLSSLKVPKKAKQLMSVRPHLVKFVGSVVMKIINAKANVTENILQ
jgi:hypothetical protein